jgi:hypothetical protein
MSLSCEDVISVVSPPSLYFESSLFGTLVAIRMRYYGEHAER